MTTNRRLEDQIIGKIDNERKKQTKEVPKGKPKPQKAKVETQVVRY
ncbi:hypothetical protein LIX87_02695 [Weissella viridescens]|nr:hypothetical protein [Weissella viridescens]MCB6839929.1 hypothetical protein [Weissella viridescens]MCB6846661.1 hypothetical protein [Weissella viridescens]